MIGALFVAALLGVALLRWPHAVLLGVFGFLMLQDLTVAVAGGKLSTIGTMFQALDEAIVCMLAVAAAARVLILGRTLRFSRWIVWYALFAVVAAVSTASAGAGWGKYLVGLLLLSKGPLLCFTIDQIEWPESSLRPVRYLIMGVAILVAVVAPFDLLAPSTFRSILGFSVEIDVRNGLPSVVSLAGHPGGYAWLLVTGALIAAATAFVGGSGKWAGISIFLTTASALSLRRKPVLGLIAAIVVASPLLLRAGSRRTLAWTAAAAVAVLIPLVLVLAPVLASGVAGYLGEGAALVQARTALYAGAYLLAREQFPFGVGLGRYGSLGSITDYSDIYYRFGFDGIDGMSPAKPNFIQDTFWPQVLGETGVLGLLAFSIMLLVITMAAWRAAQRSVGTSRVIALAAVLVMIETALESVAAPTYTTASQACIALGLARIAACADSRIQTNLSEES